MRLKIYFIALLLGMTLTACVQERSKKPSALSESGSGTPQDVVMSFIDRAKHGDLKAVSDLLSKSDRKAISDRWPIEIQPSSSYLSPPLSCVTRERITKLEEFGNQAVVHSVTYMPKNLTNFDGVFQFTLHNFSPLKVYQGQCEKAKSWQVSTYPDIEYVRMTGTSKWFLQKEGSAWRIFLGLQPYLKSKDMETRAEGAANAGDNGAANELYGAIRDLHYPFARRLPTIRRDADTKLFSTFVAIDNFQRTARFQLSRLNKKKLDYAYASNNIVIDHKLIPVLTGHSQFEARVLFSVKNAGDQDVRYLTVSASFPGASKENVHERILVLVNNLDHSGKTRTRLAAGESMSYRFHELVPKGWTGQRMDLRVAAVERYP